MLPSDPSAPVVEIQASAQLLEEGRAAEAVSRLEALSAAAPAYATSLILLAKAYEAESRWEDALDAWHRAHFLVPGSPLIQRQRRRLMDETDPRRSLGREPSAPEELVHENHVTGVSGESGEPLDSHAPVAEPPSPDEGVTEEPDVVEPFSTDELVDVASPEDAYRAEEESVDAVPDFEIPEVFVDDSDPVSDALGTAVLDEMWEDDRLDALTAEDDAGTSSEAMAGESLNADPWWKPSEEIGDLEQEDAAESGWTVVSEMETERPKTGVAEALIGAPIDDMPTQGTDETERTRTSLSDATVADDLDALIRKLEDAPRMRPDPNFIDDPQTADVEGEDENADDIVSETLARIYIAQGQYGEAANVYDKLAEEHPGQAPEFGRKAAEMRARVGG